MKDFPMKMRFLLVIHNASLFAVLMLARCGKAPNTPDTASKDRFSMENAVVTSRERETSLPLNLAYRKLQHWSLCNRQSHSRNLGQSKSSCICTKLNGNTLVDCSNGNWNTIPQQFPPNTTELIMSNNIITHIRCGDFRHLPNLTKLDLRNISLKYIDSAALDDLSHLEYLDLSLNPNYPMTNYKVNQSLFKGLKSIKILKMYGNTQYLMRGTYPDMAISELESLEELWMDGMQNRTFGPGFRNLTKLTTLKLSGKLLQQDKVIRYCSTEIVKGMFDNLQYIVDLDLRACYITYIDRDAFIGTKNLKVLDLSYNIKLELSGMTSSYDSLAKTKIEVLKLNKIYDRQYNNCGVYIKAEDMKGIKKLKYLKEIQLMHNWITKVQKDVPKLFPNTLEVVDVSNNEFRLGIYLFYINKLSGAKTLNCSYQFFPNLLRPNLRPSYEEVKFLSLHEKEKYYNEKAFLNFNERRDEKLETTTYISRKINSSQGSPPEAIPNNKELESEPNGITLFEAQLRDFMYNSKYSYENVVLVDEGPVCPTLTSHMMQYLTPELPPKLKVLDMSYSKLAHPIYAFNISANNSLITANLSSCLLHCWDGPVHGIKKLEYLDLGDNFCTKVRASFFDSFPNLRTLILSNNLLNRIISSDIGGRLMKKLVKLEKLFLTFNQLEAIPKQFLSNQVSLKYLDLSHNFLKSFDIELCHMTSLKLLNLSNNGIRSIDQQLRNDLRAISDSANRIKRTPLVVDLSNNMIWCTCNNLDFLKWIRENNGRFLNIITTSCIFENRSKTLVDISNGKTLDDAISSLEKECASYFALAASLTGLLIFVLNSIIGMVVYRYRWKIRYWYYITRNQKVTIKGTEYQPLLSLSTSAGSNWYAPVIGEYKYHAYIAYSESDKDFVLDILRTQLTTEESLRLCVPDIDFVPGQSNYRMISNAIHYSQVAIFVVSPNSFLDNEWEIAIRMAQEESLNRGRNCFFAIFLGNEPPIERMLQQRWVDVRNLYRDKRFIIYNVGASSEEKGVFWNECLRKINLEQ